MLTFTPTRGEADHEDFVFTNDSNRYHDCSNGSQSSNEVQQGKSSPRDPTFSSLQTAMEQLFAF